MRHKSGPILWFGILILLLLGAAFEFVFAKFAVSDQTIGHGLALGGESLTGLAALLVLLGFVLERYKTKGELTVNAVQIFIDRIGPKMDELGKIAKSLHGPTYSLLRMEEIEHFEWDWISACRKDIASQLMEFQSNQKNEPMFFVWHPLLREIEFLSLYLLENDLQDSPTLSVIHEALVQMVEFSAILIMTYRTENRNLMPYTIKLYNFWYKKVDRRSQAQKEKDLQEALNRGAGKD